MNSKFILFLAVLGCVAASAPSKLHAADDGIEFFEKKIRPVLVQHCYKCHAPDAKELKGGLSVHTAQSLRKGGESGPAIVPGDTEQSLLLQAIRYTGDFYDMPPQQKLPKAVIADFTHWIKIGAPDPRTSDPNATTSPAKQPKTIDWEEASRFWAFQPIEQPKLPQVKNKNWPQQRLDHFVLARLESASLSPSPPVDKRALLRRATFGLTGLPPTPQQIESFLNDHSADAYVAAIDRLLASPRYGERWGRHWLDVARYADSNGLDENLAYVNAFRYRDYVIDSFNEDKPFDQFVREQIAGDLIAGKPGEPEQRQLERFIATGFLSLGSKMLAEDDPRKLELDIVDEQVDTTARAFMGITMGCARCHDHKFDPISTEDYYSLAAIFKSTKTMEHFNVVAVWHEHTLATDAQQQQVAQADKQIREIDKRIKKIEQTAKNKFRQKQRELAGTYLAATLHWLDVAGETKASAPGSSRKLTKIVDLEDQLPRTDAIVLEAENYSQGNAFRNKQGYIESKVSGRLITAAYEFLVPAAGNYLLQWRYASRDSRPVQLTIAGHVVNPRAAAEKTGGFSLDHGRWFAEEIVTLPKGKNVVQISLTGAIPHFDKIALIKTSNPATIKLSAKPRKTLSQVAQSLHLHPETLRQWVAYAQDPGKQQIADLRRKAQHAKLDLKDDLPAAARFFTERFKSLLRHKHQQQGSEEKNNSPALQSIPPELAPYAKVWKEDKNSPFRDPRNIKDFFEKQTQTSLARLSKEKQAIEKSKPALAKAMGVRDGTVQEMKVHIRGNYLTLGKEVPRRFPRIIRGVHQTPISKQSSGRLEFARWLTNENHPLTARVIANRVWRWHFGRGIVRTPDNFGKLGERPTHPKLLDHLASSLIRSGWSIKALHRQIMLSATYQMSTQYSESANATDPENRLFWRFERRRLDAEEIRDAMLSVAGNIDLSMHGQLLTVKQRAYVTGTDSKRTRYDQTRRSVYLPVIRSNVYNLFQAFDFPDPSMLSGNRSSTTVAPQALFMMNGKLVTQQAELLAADILKRKSLEDRERIETLYLRLYGREATPQEIERQLTFVQKYAQALKSQAKQDSDQKSENEAANSRDLRLLAWRGLCRVLLASNEFVYLE